VIRLDRVLPALGRSAGSRLRVWEATDGPPRVLAGDVVAWRPALGATGTPGTRETPEGPAWFEPVPDAPGTWLEVRGTADAAAIASVVGAMLGVERETAQVAAELSDRYEEIDLIYTISEILGHTIRLEEAADRILREVSTVVRARRATILAYDDGASALRIVAARGMDPADIEPIEVDDPCSVAARVFREGKIISYDPTDPSAENPACGEDRPYRGKAFLSVPVLYATPGGVSKPIGVVNLTDREGNDAFTAGDRKLIAAIANQIGAALENARLVQRDLGQQRLRRELELAHDLQLKLLPSPLVIAARADVAARCRPAESVGGDFYNLLRLHGDRVGVMVGDVSSHGFGAALIMALAMAASGIHAESAESPAEVLSRLEESLADELAKTEMYLSLVYAVIDPVAGRIAYANAGHPHAFIVSPGETPVRLGATRPPLGLAPGNAPGRELPWRKRRDMLALFTDGVADARNARGEPFGEERVLGHVRRMDGRPAPEILAAISTELDAFSDGAAPTDDRTIVLLRV
jgi:sigma-B regulation protein RsbU (phosphoserine phosphatase)